MNKNTKFILILESIDFVLVNFIVIPFLLSRQMFTGLNYLKWTIFWFLIFSMLGNVLFAHKFTSGRKLEWVFFLSAGILISCLLSYVIYTLIFNKFNFNNMDWAGALDKILSFDALFYGIQILVFIGVSSLYFTFFDRKMLLALRTTGLMWRGKTNTIESNLENSRFMKKEEIEKIFKCYKFSALENTEKDGVPILAKMTDHDRDLDVGFNSPCHALIIGSTGSGKTTTFVSPMIQILAKTKAKSSMVITDPKGELFDLHSAFLASQGYNVKVIDLRDTYQSYYKQCWIW